MSPKGLIVLLLFQESYDVSVIISHDWRIFGWAESWQSRAKIMSCAKYQQRFIAIQSKRDFRQCASRIRADGDNAVARQNIYIVTSATHVGNDRNIDVLLSRSESSPDAIAITKPPSSLAPLQALSMVPGPPPDKRW